MGYNVVPTVITGDSWTAGNNNTYIRDNFKASLPDTITEVGQIPYGGTLSNTNEYLTIGSYLQTLRVNSGAIAPEWVTKEYIGIRLDGPQWSSADFSWCQIGWSWKTFDEGGFWNAASSYNRVKIPLDGIYQVSGMFGYQIGAGDTVVKVRIGPNDYEVGSQYNHVATDASVSFCIVKRYSANDLIHADIYCPAYAGMFGESPNYGTGWFDVRYLGAST